MSAAWSAYRLLSSCAGVLAPGVRLLAPPAERALWDERLGRIAAPPGPDAWLHAASLGEAVAARALVDALRKRAPGTRLHLTATTRTGRSSLREIDPGASLAPLDTPQASAHFFDALRPCRMFLIESELWPQWLLRADAAGVPVAVVSARLSRKSAQRYRWLGKEFRRLAAGLAGVLCQGPVERERWIGLGACAERTAVVGNLKIDALPVPASDRPAARAALGLDDARPLLVLGSLRPREAGPLGRAWRELPERLRTLWQVVAVPRHLDASRGLRAEATAAGVTVVDGGAPATGSWRWDDRPGVLRDYYAAADVAFVGGSLFPYGGHNPLEPAACGAAVMIGPHHGAQALAMEILESAGAISIAARGRLSGTLRLLLADDEARARRAAAGLEAVRSSLGAAGRAVKWLEAWKLWPVA